MANPIRVKISSTPRRGTRQLQVDAAGRRGVLCPLRVRLPARLDRDLQGVGVQADVLFLVGRRAANQLHPRRDDAVLASEVAITEGLGVVEGCGSRELALERSDVRVDGFGGGLEEIGHE
jgi:hypothetical protein